MMGNPASLLERRLGRADVHVAVHLAAVGADDLARITASQIYGKISFAHAGGAHYEYESIHIDEKRGRKFWEESEFGMLG